MFTSILEPSHLIVILVVALLVLGPKRLPEAGRALGQGLKEFRGSLSGGHDEASLSRPPTSPDAHDDRSASGRPSDG